MKTKKTPAEKLAYTIKHLPNRMTVDLEGRRDVIIAELASTRRDGMEWNREDQAEILAAIEAILAAREKAQ
jgi:hypothetical protein